MVYVLDLLKTVGMLDAVTRVASPTGMEGTTEWTLTIHINRNPTSSDASSTTLVFIQLSAQLSFFPIFLVQLVYPNRSTLDAM